MAAELTLSAKVRVLLSCATQLLERKLLCTSCSRIARAKMKKSKMRAGVAGSFSEKAEQIKWWDALHALVGQSDDVEKGLQLVRECRPPDAQWLAALVPAGVL
jgi:hypothetical protein